MEQGLKYIIENNGILKEARTFLLQNIKEFPTYDLLDKDFLSKNPNIIQAIKQLKGHN